MKELWFFMIHLFEGAEKAAKKIKRQQKRHVYEECIERLFSDYPLNRKISKIKNGVRIKLIWLLPFK